MKNVKVPITEKHNFDKCLELQVINCQKLDSFKSQSFTAENIPVIQEVGTKKLNDCIKN